MTNVPYTKAIETGVILPVVDIFFSNNVRLYCNRQQEKVMESKLTKKLSDFAKI